MTRPADEGGVDADCAVNVWDGVDARGDAGADSW
jgi:hypothetical protein